VLLCAIVGVVLPMIRYQAFVYCWNLQTWDYLFASDSMCLS